MVLVVLGLVACRGGSSQASGDSTNTTAATQATTLPTDPIPDSVGSTRVLSDRIQDDRLAWILGYAAARSLDSLPFAHEQGIYLRLYAVPAEGRCVEETHAVCAYRHYLAAIGDGEGIPPAVFDLGWLGQISDIQWLPRNEGQAYGLGRLKIEVVNFPPHVFQNRRDRRVVRYELTVT